MMQTTINLPCPVCKKQVFKDDPVVRCSSCDVFQHVHCWEKVGVCRGSLDCKGRPEDVIVVRLPNPGPTEVDIARAVENRLKQMFEKLERGLSTTPAASAADLDRAVQRIEAAVERARSLIASEAKAAARDVETKVGVIQTAVKQIEQRASHAPRPLDRLTLDKALRRLEDRLDALSKENAERLDALMRTAREEIATELQRTAEAVEACRHDVTAARHPLPWETPEGAAAFADLEDANGAGERRQGDTR